MKQTGDRCVITCIKVALGHFPGLFMTLLLTHIFQRLFQKILDLVGHCLSRSRVQKNGTFGQPREQCHLVTIGSTINSSRSQQPEAKVIRTVLSVVYFLWLSDPPGKLNHSIPRTFTDLLRSLTCVHRRVTFCKPRI